VGSREPRRPLTNNRAGRALVVERGSRVDGPWGLRWIPEVASATENDLDELDGAMSLGAGWDLAEEDGVWT